MKLRGPLFDAIDASQDNSPLTKYLRRRAETMLGEYELPVGECVNETIVRCFEYAGGPEDLVSHLQYAAHELTKAAMTARRAVQEDPHPQEVNDGG